MNVDPKAEPGLDADGRPIPRRAILPHGSTPWGAALSPRGVLVDAWALAGRADAVTLPALAAVSLAARALLAAAALPAVPFLRRWSISRGLRGGWVLQAPEARGAPPPATVGPHGARGSPAVFRCRGLRSRE
jgi:hypothetical protein